MSIMLDVMTRSLIAFFALLLLVRLIGKQQMAELTFFDYIVGITIGSIAAELSVQTERHIPATLAGMAIWTVLPIILAYLSLHSVWVRKVFEGEAIVVIENGKLLEQHLSKARLSIDDLIAQLRIQGVFNISDVEFALFESNGKLSVQKKAIKRSLTPDDLSLSPQYEGLPTTLIEDGVLLIDALRSLKLSKAWLHHYLKQANIAEVQQVSLAQLDTQGNLYVDLQGDRPFFIIPTHKNQGD